MGNLLYWAVIFLIIALVAAFLGFGGVAGVATDGRPHPLLGCDHPRRSIVHRRHAAPRLGALVASAHRS